MLGSDEAGCARELAVFLASTTGADAAKLADDLGATPESIVEHALTHQEAVLAKASEDDAEGYYYMVLTFLKRLEGEALAKAVKAIVDCTTASTEQRPLLRLKALTHVFNAVDERGSKLALLAAAISYASTSKQLDQLAPFLAGAATWQRDWQLTDVEARTLWLLLSDAYGKAGDGHAAQAFLIRYLSTFEAEAAAGSLSAAALEEAKAHAKEAALGYIRAPALSQRSALAHLAVVRALKDDARYAKLHELLTIFATQGLPEYAAFHAANGPLVASLGVDHEASLRAMRLLTLTSLAAGAKGPLSYDAVAAAISVPVADVESWVVQAIGEGLIDARMDQTKGELTVTRATQRDFGAAQWTHLQSKLRAWRDSVSGLLSLVEGGSAAGAGGR